MPSLLHTIALTGILGGTTLAAILPPNGLKIGTTLLPAQESEGKFTVTQVPNDKYTFNPSLSVYRTYLKYGVEPPEELKATVANITLARAAARKRTTGTVIADPIDEFDDAYVSPVQIGTPPQTLNLDFDTGSSDLWVFSSQTPSNQVAGQSVYTTSASSTAQQLSGYTWSITYGDGSSSSGVVYNDVVSIGGVSVTQAVEVATTVSDQFTSTAAIDGLLGLGFDSLNTVEPVAQKTFISNALAQLDAPLFSVDLKYHAGEYMGIHEHSGTYDFGFIDSTKYTGTITYTNVNTSPGYWTFTSSGYGVGSTFTSTSITGIADTGTTLTYLPAAVVSAYYAQVTGATNSASAGGYIFPCTSTLPTFTVGIGTARIVIPAKVLNFGALSATTCFGGLQSSAGIGINIFGDTTLKAAYVVFDRSTTPPRLGWASKTV